MENEYRKWSKCCNNSVFLAVLLSIARAIPAVQHDLNFAVVACDVVMEKRGETAKLRRALVDYKTKDKSKAKR